MNFFFSSQTRPTAVVPRDARPVPAGDRGATPQQDADGAGDGVPAVPPALECVCV